MKSFMAAAAVFAILTLTTQNNSCAQQVLKAGSTTAGQPASGLNPETKQLEGIAVELLSAIAKDAGLEVEFQTMTFAELQPALLNKQIDIIAASYGVTPARQELVDFTDVYGSYRDVLVVRNDNMKVYSSTADFKGMTIAIPRGSAYIDGLKNAGANLIFVSTPPEAINELEAGRVTGVVDNGLQLVYRLRNNAHPNLRLVDSYQPIQVGKLAFAVRKGNPDLLAKLNLSLGKLQTDGTLKAIYSRWGVK
jgi:polar amino acid transport system substrate-binding protein